MPKQLSTTIHGENIADQIQGEDAYGRSGKLNIADLYAILDNLQTHFMDTGNDALMHKVTQWLDELIAMDDRLPL